MRGSLDVLLAHAGMARPFAQAADRVPLSSTSPQAAHRSVPPPAGLFTRVNTVNELSVDTSRGEMLAIHVRSLCCSMRQHDSPC